MASTLESKVEERKDNNEKTVDREKTCPLLLRVFCSNGRHNNIGEYRRGNTPPNELQIYTWMDATLKEIGSLILEVNPDTRRRGTVFEFRLVYPELTKTIPRMKELGSIVIGQKGFDDNKTLAQLGFVIGDFLDIAITSPGRGMPPQRRMRPY
ncbi:histone deacetylase complex subunit SAP18-like [Portunus trituberculatus]|uniref:18 kDa Sin3-associated polypeptide n=1 Tax=Portunus trituberculatus TaxID=210409 RepID=A0A5B7CXD2_PORTR|nr:histone deacetylase complex subunit SAP18-like [Portunus trituberculatus]MPC14080.1 Histone deacetylase complex subunit SAP18 [Portunus trituberculatus]